MLIELICLKQATEQGVIIQSHRRIKTGMKVRHISLVFPINLSILITYGFSGIGHRRFYRREVFRYL